jgi:hypothetical protein
MAGGHSEQKYPPYYGGYPYPYPHIRFETPTAVKILFYGLIIMIIVQFLRLTADIIRSIYFNPGADYRTGIILSGILFSISGLLFWAFIILLVISVFLFHRGKFEFNQQHHENIKWARIFIISYFIVFALTFVLALVIVASMFLSEQYYGIPGYYTGISNVITILVSFFLGFLILFLVKEIISPRDRDLLYIFAGLMVLIPLIQAITVMIEYSQIASDDFVYSSETIFSRLAFFGFCNLVIWIIAAVAFYNISKRLKVNERTIPVKPAKFLPRPKAISKYLYQFYTKPKRAILAVVIVALIIGAGVGVSAQALQDRIYEPLRSFREERFSEPGEYQRSEDGALNEGESVDIDLDIHSNIIVFEVYLNWMDEPDQGRRDNKPDTFTLLVDLAGESRSDTDQNPQGGQGEIGLNWNYDENESYYVNTALITITLESAGDQEGPVGLPFSPYTIPDNSNEYYLDIYFVYIEEW